VTDLKSLAAAAFEGGWASGSGDVESIRKQAAKLGWTEIAPRRGDPTVSVLRPTPADIARPNSLSSKYGLGQQPLHTDGAHLSNPPDVVVLIADSPSLTATRLWSTRGEMPPRGAPNAAFWNGMFLIRNGRDSFYAPALSAQRYRYDPGCMTPCDARAREVAQFFDDQLGTAAAHEWKRAGQLVVIDNRHTLHARSAVAEGDWARELIRVAFKTKAAR
jgi:Taurine catabolism dioxygenase TauD, TfdA family